MFHEETLMPSASWQQRVFFRVFYGFIAALYTRTTQLHTRTTHASPHAHTHVSVVSLETEMWNKWVAIMLCNLQIRLSVTFGPRRWQCWDAVADPIAAAAHHLSSVGLSAPQEAPWPTARTASRSLVPCQRPRQRTSISRQSWRTWVRVELDDSWSYPWFDCAGIMAYPLQNVPKYGSKYHTWMCDNPNKFLTTDARDVFSETFFKVFPLVFPGEQQNPIEVFTLKRERMLGIKLNKR